MTPLLPKIKTRDNIKTLKDIWHRKNIFCAQKSVYICFFCAKIKQINNIIK